ncbi:hypothetical protein D3C84_624830 [compost metagenome]
MRILAELGTALGELVEELANLIPAGRGNVLAVAILQARDDQLQEFRGLLLQVLLFEIARGAAGLQAIFPFGQQLCLVVLHRIERAGLQCRHGTCLLECMRPIPQKMTGAKQ